MRPIHLHDEELDAADLDDIEALEHSDLPIGRWGRKRQRKSDIEELLEDLNCDDIDELAAAEIADLLTVFKDE